MVRVMLLTAAVVTGVTAAAVAVSPNEDGQYPSKNLSTSMLCLLLALPHFLYATVWRFPSFWIRTLGPDKKLALDRFAAFAAFLKPLQFIYYISWWSGMLQSNPKYDAVFLVCAVIGVLLTIAGQVS
jgi:hypothetical protein